MDLSSHSVLIGIAIAIAVSFLGKFACALGYSQESIRSGSANISRNLILGKLKLRPADWNVRNEEYFFLAVVWI
jgi:hypothetical protein